MKAEGKQLNLSIVIPVYNRQEGLNNLLTELSKSVLTGGFNDQIEVIVVDDGSDESIGLSGDLPFPVQLVRNNKNSGAPYSRKKGYQLSKGMFVHFHDSDDSITDQWLSDVLDELKDNSEIDLLLTGRLVYEDGACKDHYQKFCHQHANQVHKIAYRLVYQNCIGPLGGVTFSRKVLEKVTFKQLSACQDWQMYLDVIDSSTVFDSLPDTYFIFNKTGADRISHNPRKKILGHLQLARITANKSIIKKNIRLFYLYACKQQVFTKGGSMLRFYKRKYPKIIIIYLLVNTYWRLTEIYLGSIKDD